MFLLFLTPILSSCGNEKKEITFAALDTVVSLSLSGSEEDLNACREEVLLCDRLFGQKEGSDILALNAGNPPSDPKTVDLVGRSLLLCRETDGLLDITLGRLSSLWGFGTNSPHVPEKSEIEKVLALSGYPKVSVENGSISIPEGLSLDVGATAKGYLSDSLRSLCESRGISSALFSLGGNVTVIGTKPGGSDWRIGILDPVDRNKNACIVTVRDTNVITSGIYQRFFEENGTRYCHVFDPRTGYPVENGLASVTVICRDGLRADALSTALLVMGLDDGLAYQKSHPGFEAIFITESGEIFSTGIAFEKA